MHCDELIPALELGDGEIARRGRDAPDEAESAGSAAPNLFLVDYLSQGLTGL